MTEKLLEGIVGMGFFILMLLLIYGAIIFTMYLSKKGKI